jgi:hypothetical protein
MINEKEFNLIQSATGRKNVTTHSINHAVFKMSGNTTNIPIALSDVLAQTVINFWVPTPCSSG